MADIFNSILNIAAVAVAGVAAWVILFSFRDLPRTLPLRMVMSRLEMPPDEKEILRERLINQCAEDCRGSWSPQWDQPTGNLNIGVRSQILHFLHWGQV